MGKAQSKRSVDITTEVKKDDVPEEGTGKMGKIEDVDQLKPQVNGDTHHNDAENGDKEKSADTEGTENEKDLSTEKEQQSTQAADEVKPNAEGGDGDMAAATTPTGDKPVENGNDETLNESKTETTENGDSSKKPKKEKGVKKKWSLRSISFGKKDKQKPPKKEEATTNGECEKVPEEATEEATKSADATAEEKPAVAEVAAASDASPSAEKSPADATAAATPAAAATETKEVTTPATENASAEPVVNGSSEPAKEEKPVAEVAPTVVAEEKAPENAATNIEAPAKEEAAPAVAEVAAPVAETTPAAADAPAVAAESAKAEETPVPAKIEENGFGENHAAENSATESLNGHDHKSIEEIKSDCSEKLLSEPTTELAAGTVEVKE